MDHSPKKSLERCVLSPFGCSVLASRGERTLFFTSSSSTSRPLQSVLIFEPNHLKKPSNRPQMLSSSAGRSQFTHPFTVLVRGVRTKSKGGLPPAAQRVVTQMSVMAASRKQPKLLKLSREDLIKHQTIQRCWSTYQAELRAKRNEQLKLQYKSTQKAMNLLQELNPDLFEAANAPEHGKRFPMELKVPTDFPPRKIWYYGYKKKD